MIGAAEISPTVFAVVVTILLVSALVVGDRGYLLIVAAAAVLAFYVYGATT